MAILKGNNQKNTLNGGIGSDLIYGYGDDDILIGDAGNDLLKGGGGADILIGGDGNDILNGGGGIDIMMGGNGDDIYFVDDAADVTTELADAGNDTVRSSINWALAANLEKLILTGTAAINGTGNAWDNTVKGNDANNVLDGGSGDDFLIGGLGVDSLWGGAGNDTLKISDFNGDTIDGGTGYDNLQIAADNQVLDLRNAPSIKNIEAIRLGDSYSTLIVTAQSLLDLSSDSNTLKVDASGGSNTLEMDGGWTDEGIINSYRTFSKDGATLQVNQLITDIQGPELYTISDATRAASVGSIFDSGMQEITIDFGGKVYKDWGVSSIDLTGFGLEDKLLVALRDGGIQGGNGYTSTEIGSHSNTPSNDLYMNQSKFETYSFLGNDRVFWRKITTNALMTSKNKTWRSSIRTFTTSYGAKNTTKTWISFKYSGSVELIGLPVGLSANQFVFI